MGSFLNGTSESAYEGDTSTHANDVTIDSTKRKRAMRCRLAPILRTAYYGRKRLMGGIRNFVSSVTEYAAGASINLSSRKIPFYSLLVIPIKPKTKNKTPDPVITSVLCDTGASISLAPVSISKEMKIKVDKTRTRSVRGADGKRLKTVGMGVVYMKAKASPVWKRIEVVITKTGVNFLLSHTDLKNLNLLSVNFPEYLGERRRGLAKNIREEEEIITQVEHPL